MSGIKNWNGKRLKEAMVIRGLSNQDLAKELDVNWKTVHKWQNNFSQLHPTLEQLWQISIILDFPYKHFITHDYFDYECYGIFY